MPGSLSQVPRTPLEKKWLAGVFWGAGLALGSELLDQNGIHAEISFAGGIIIMIVGCVALILSDRRKKNMPIEPSLSYWLHDMIENEIYLATSEKKKEIAAWITAVLAWTWAVMGGCAENPALFWIAAWVWAASLLAAIHFHHQKNLHRETAQKLENV